MRFGQFITTTTGLPDDIHVEYDKVIFEQMVNLITSLSPQQLSEEQRTKIVDIITSFNLSVKSQYTDAMEMSAKSISKMTDYYTENKEELDKSHSLNRGFRWR